jgi:thiosulfate dehydrogenase [quinone] large subunit
MQPTVLDRLRQDPRWVLLPLRAYLAFTFLYAGLSKVADRSFLDKSDPTSMYATLVAVKGQSPIGSLLGPVQDHATAFGLLMAFGEIAVGVGMLFGLFTRIAALGGMLISLSLFLTVSWNATPWYTGADIVYLFAFTPVVLAGAGPVSADAWLAAARERDVRRNRASRKTRENPKVIEARDRTRRALLGGIAGLAGLIALGSAALARGTKPAAKQTALSANREDPDPTSNGAATTSTPPGGEPIVAASAVPVGGAVRAMDPKTGAEIFVLQLEADTFTALDSTCPHQGCAVSFISKASGFVCPCHDSTFDATGAVTRGPAVTGLAKVPVAKSGNEVLRT